LYLKEILLRNFRNYRSLELSFSPHLNILIGTNAQGKTNLLEAIFYLAANRSHRALKDDELVSYQYAHFFIKGKIISKTKKYLLEIGYEREKKRKVIKLNGKKEQFQAVAAILPAVLFIPEDLELIKGSPQERRRFLDNEIVRLNVHYYYYYLQNYKRALQQRNLLLKEQKRIPELLEPWEEQLINNGSQIIRYRLQCIKKMRPLAARLHSQLTGQEEKLFFTYRSSFPLDEDFTLREIAQQFRDSLRRGQKKDYLLKSTQLGPHRDDLCIFINGKEARRFASQGQQRTAVLALKLSEIELFFNVNGFYPILLLDDVLSELDAQRRSFLVKLFQKQVQTFLTTTRYEDLERNLKEEGTLFKVEQGRVSPWNCSEKL
jgi:DNA replication and repair protein RecF